MNAKTLLLITLLTITVVLINRVAEEGVKRVDKRLAAKPASQQDYYLNDFSITSLDSNGEPQHSLQAMQLSHFSNGEQTRLQQPRIEVFRQGAMAWRVSAEQGMVTPQQDEVLLSGDVILRQGATKTPLQLTTESLSIHPSEGTAETDQAVTLVQGKNRIKAVGMKLQQEGPRLQLLSQVRGHYEALP
jgi:lipopolysaccharide export system protein LptC